MPAPERLYLIYIIKQVVGKHIPSRGPNDIMCGSVGYAKCDAQYAKKTIITNNFLQ